MPNNNVEFLISTDFDRRGINEAEKAIGGMGDAAKGAGGGFDILKIAAGNFLADVAMQLPAQILAAGQYIVELGANAQETAGLIDNSLGPAAAGFRDEMEQIADTTKRSVNELYEGSSSILAMSRSMGFAQEEAAGFTAQMSQIAVDLGSFFNQDSSQVFIDLQSAMAGSAETMQKYGIDVSVTALETAALNMGLIEQGEKMDRVTRATVLQAEIMRQAADAMGDAERTSDSYTNQMRGLQAVINETATKLGEELIPAITPMVAKFGEFASVTGPKVVSAFADAVEITQDYITVVSNLRDEAGLLVEFTTTMAQVMLSMNKSTAEALVSWDTAANILTAGLYPILSTVNDELLEQAEVTQAAQAAMDEYAHINTQAAAGSSAAWGQTAEAQASATREAREAAEAQEDLTRATAQGDGRRQESTLLSRQRAKALEEEAEAAAEAAEAEAEAAEKRRQALIAAESAALQTSESLFADLYEAQQAAIDAQGEYVQVWRDSSTEIADVSGQLAGDLDKDQKKIWEEALATAEEGSSEWLTAYKTLQNDLTDTQRAALIAQRADLEGQGGAWETVYTGDMRAAQEAQAAIEAANAAISKSYKEAAFDAIVASNGFNESTAQLAVNLGLMTEDEANAKLAFVETTTAIQELTSNINFLNDSSTDQAEALQLMSLGYTSSVEEAMKLADELSGNVSKALLEANMLTQEQINLFDELSGRKELELNISVTGMDSLKAVRDEVNGIRNAMAAEGAGTSRSSGFGGTGGMSESEMLESMGGKL